MPRKPETAPIVVSLSAAADPIDDDCALLCSAATNRPPLLVAFAARRPLAPVPVTVESAVWPLPAVDEAVALAAPVRGSFAAGGAGERRSRRLLTLMAFAVAMAAPPIAVWPAPPVALAVAETVPEPVRAMMAWPTAPAAPVVAPPPP